MKKLSKVSLWERRGSAKPDRASPGSGNAPNDLARRLVEAHYANRLIETEYRYLPRTRPFARTAAGLHIVQLSEEAAPSAHHWLGEAARYRSQFRNIPARADPSSPTPAWINGMLPGLDAMMLYTFIRSLRPNVYLEIGSGNSTKFARRAIEDGALATRIISIDPFPRAEVDALCDEIIRTPLEDLDDLRVFADLSLNDVVFIDNGHRSFQNSDVTVFFTEALWTIPPGVYYGVHDIFLPNDYPDAWKDRFYNEQYLLTCYLLGGADGDEIVFPGVQVSKSPEFRSTIDDLFEGDHFANAPWHAGAFWLRRGGRN